MRIFIGIELPQQIREAAAAIADSLRDRLAHRVDARWIPASNLHITLWFIGETSDDAAHALMDAVGRPFQHSPFEIAIAGLGMFPGSGAPRIFWLGVESGAESLLQLHGALATRLRPLGIEPERRPYSAHLTLARVKSVSPRGPFRDLRAELRAIPAVAGTCRVEAVTIFRSHLSPKGASYESLLRVPLQ